jgi:hypothetical protein
MRHTIWYTDMFISLINAERTLYKLKELARDGDGEGSDLFGNCNVMLANVSEQIDWLVEEAKEDDYPFTELESVEFVKPSDTCELCSELYLRNTKAKIKNKFINVCKKHSKGNRPSLYENSSFV